ncbi:hypothetical protein LCGC14_2659450 [marine sediment metagenome]|uniref:Uncharacterized protein n=2 Tax=marine sediment metagenome TaxID=412755 RepID=A0A0F9C2P0_9ZZZZ
MELNFKTLEEQLQDYINEGLWADLDTVTPGQRLGFIEKYMEFVSPKQLRRGTSTASDDKDFRLVEVE